MAAAVGSPSLSARALAELISLPAYEQLRVLYAQKYPKSEPQSFRIPFYQPALAGIRDYYRSGNNPNALKAARLKASSAGLASRRSHNLRVIDQFEKSSQAKRSLQPKTSPSYSTMISGVQVRLKFDLVALEGSTVRHLLYNLRDAEIEDETLRLTLELAAYSLQNANIAIPIKHLEYVDITNGQRRSITSIRAGSVKRVVANAKLIKTLWPTI